MLLPVCIWSISSSSNFRVRRAFAVLEVVAEELRVSCYFCCTAGNWEMMFEAWYENAPEHQEQEVEQDHASFDDSDRFEDESICSFETESSSNNNWQGWKKPPPANGSGPSPQPQRALLTISDNSELCRALLCSYLFRHTSPTILNWMITLCTQACNCCVF